VIGNLRNVSVYAYGEPCDMRKSFDTLAALVTEKLGHDFLKGDLFLFVGRSRKRAKVLYFDGTGVCLFAKRLEKGLFATPWKGPMSRRLELTMTELALFIEGSEALGRVELSPPLLRESDLRSKVFEEKSSPLGI
jgi:transposase